MKFNQELRNDSSKKQTRLTEWQPRLSLCFQMRATRYFMGSRRPFTNQPWIPTWMIGDQTE